MFHFPVFEKNGNFFQGGVITSFTVAIKNNNEDFAEEYINN